LGDAAELFVTAVTELDQPSFPTVLGDGARAGQSLNIARRREAVTMIAELG
jgi:hypothetical protein